MPLEINGFIEYSIYDSLEERAEESSWLTWMYISSMIGYVDNFTEYLFGYSKRVIRDNFEVSALAKDRNIPTNPSDFVRRELNFISEFEKIQETDTFGHTYIYYNEIQDKSNKGFNSKEWSNLFILIDKFMTLKNLNGSQIRLIVWYSW